MFTVSTNQLERGWTVTPVGRVAAPLREQVTAELRRAILEFELKPGQRLIERELLEKLGVSRATVREALRELSTEGLVTVEPQRGAFVAVPSLEEAAEMYEIRAVLESLLIRFFIERASDEQVRQLRATVEEIAEETARDDDVYDLLASKDRFYAVLEDGAQSPTLTQQLDSLKARVRVLRATSLSFPGRGEEVVAELRAILDAIEDRDVERAAERCVEHIRAASRTALRKLEPKADS